MGLRTVRCTRTTSNYVVRVQRCSCTVRALYTHVYRCTKVPSYFRKYKYESTFVLSKIIHPYNRSSTNTTTTYEGTCTTLYNVRVQNTYESTVHVLYTRTRTLQYCVIFFCVIFFLNNFYFTLHVQYNVLYSTCTVRVVYVYSCTHTIKLCCTLSTLHVYVVVS